MTDHERASDPVDTPPEAQAAHADPDTLVGTVVSQQANFYYVKVEGQKDEIACHLRGRLKKEGETPYVGDRVQVVLEPPRPGEKLPPPREGSLMLSVAATPSVRKGFIDQVLPRRSMLKRPTLANVDLVLLVFSAAHPEFNPFLLDKFLISTAQCGFEVLIVINKRDLVPPEQLAAFCETYTSLGYTVVTSEASAEGVQELLPHLAGKVSVLAGPSGVGKSSLLNAIQPGLRLRTGEVSEKLQRGKHTTRHAALFPIASVENALVADTPGFSFLETEMMEPAELGWHFPEMREAIPDCRFPSCLHATEPQCAVKERASISEARYESYLRLLDELQEMWKQASARSLREETSFKRRTGQKGQETRMVKVDAAAREANRRTQHQRMLAEVHQEGDEPLDEDDEG